MRFVEIIKHKKIALIGISLFLYVIFNLLEGERGLISYYEKQKIKQQMVEEKKSFSIELAKIEKKNMLLTNKVDLDYLEMLYREKFMVGTPNEYIYKSN